MIYTRFDPFRIAAGELVRRLYLIACGTIKAIIIESVWLFVHVIISFSVYVVCVAACVRVVVPD